MAVETELAARKAAVAFAAAPSAEALAHFDHCLLHADSHHHAKFPEIYRAAGLELADFLPFLDQPRTGRSWQRIDPGGCAATCIGFMIQAALVPREATLALLRARLAVRSKDLRRNVAYVLTRCDLHAGNVAVAVELGCDRDAEHLRGVLLALGPAIQGARPSESTPRVAMAPLLPVFRATLVATHDARKLGLWTLRSWCSEYKRPGDLAPLLPDLVALLDDAKPSVVVDAVGVLKAYVSGVYRKTADYDPQLAIAARRAVAIVKASKPVGRDRRLCAADELLQRLDGLAGLDARTAALVVKALGR